MQHKNNANEQPSAKTALLLQACPERRLIRSTGSKRAVDFSIQVKQMPVASEKLRTPLKLALVLDRSGSMQGEKLQTAKSAALAVLDQLTPRDQIAVVIFDDRIETVQKLAPVTAKLKNQLRQALQAIQARANTALHEGWLTGCNAIADEHVASQEQALARCFLLTDGLANAGITDPEHIASEAAGIREHTGISTSTFGIGNDYNELLLGPMAVAGGGQFHHLRTADEITKSFVGELGGLLAIVAHQVYLELEVEPGVNIDLISAYWEKTAPTNTTQRSIALSDLQNGDERHVIIRFNFPAQENQEQHIVRARVVWLADDMKQYTDWQELRFSYASQSACDDEPQNADVMHQVGLQEADHARREAIRYNNLGDLPSARKKIAGAAQAIAVYGQNDPTLQEELKQLQNLEKEIANAPMAPAAAKELYYQQQNRSRQQKDYRSGEPENVSDTK
jgi:Ca-activated chloride channel homolog